MVQERQAATDFGLLKDRITSVTICISKSILENAKHFANNPSATTNVNKLVFIFKITNKHSSTFPVLA